MLLRDCEGLYKCGKGTDELCSKALCPFYKPQSKEPKLIETKRIATIQAKPKVEEGEWVLDDFSGLCLIGGRINAYKGESNRIRNTRSDNTRDKEDQRLDN